MIKGPHTKSLRTTYWRDRSFSRPYAGSQFGTYLNPGRQLALRQGKAGLELENERLKEHLQSLITENAELERQLQCLRAAVKEHSRVETTPVTSEPVERDADWTAASELLAGVGEDELEIIGSVLDKSLTSVSAASASLGAAKTPELLALLAYARLIIVAVDQIVVTPLGSAVYSALVSAAASAEVLD